MKVRVCVLELAGTALSVCGGVLALTGVGREAKGLGGALPHSSERRAPSALPPLRSLPRKKAQPMSGPPPSSWLGDPPPSTSLAAVASPDAGRGGASAGGLAPPALPTASADAAYSTWRHVRRVARDEASASGDLYDQLVNSSRETQYSLQPAGVSFGGWAWQAKEKEGVRVDRLMRKAPAGWREGGATLDSHAPHRDEVGCGCGLRTAHRNRVCGPSPAPRTAAMGTRRNSTPPNSPPPSPSSPFAHAQWPPLLRSCSPMVAAMPTAVSDRYAACQVRERRARDGVDFLSGGAPCGGGGHPTRPRLYPALSSTRSPPSLSFSHPTLP